MRQELKYRLTQRQDALLDNTFNELLEKDEHCKKRPYTVMSIYFDNERDMDFHNGNDGLYHRKKHRIRYYDETLKHIKLEKKEKWGDRSLKTSLRISKQDMLSLLNGQCNCLIDKGTLGQDAYNHFHHSGLRPKVFIAYDRVAYILPYSDIRITFDRNLRFCEIINGQIYESMPLILADADYANILEVKYNHFLPNFIKQILHVQNLQRVAVSKYNLSRLMLTNRK